MSITQVFAQKVLDRAQQAARDIGVPMNVAVLDNGGHLKAFVRMDGAVLGSIDIALKKAKTSVLFEMTTEQVGEYSKPGGSSRGLEATNDVLVTFAGGIPLKSADGQNLGAVGVSGGSVDQDRLVATAASSGTQIA